MFLSVFIKININTSVTKRKFPQCSKKIESILKCVKLSSVLEIFVVFFIYLNFIKKRRYRYPGTCRSVYYYISVLYICYTCKCVFQSNPRLDHLPVKSQTRNPKNKWRPSGTKRLRLSQNPHRHMIEGSCAGT